MHSGFYQPIFVAPQIEYNHYDYLELNATVLTAFEYSCDVLVDWFSFVSITAL